MRLSFRDPAGFVFRDGEQIYCCVSPSAVPPAREFLDSAFARAKIAEGSIARTIAVEGPPPETSAEVEIAPGSLLLAHQPIAFPNYPYEWPTEMLEAAAGLTLRLAQEALTAGFTLKDATPFNVMFEGPRPVFLDVLSFDRSDPLAPVWRAYAQFVQTFLYPLLASRYLGLRLDEMLLVHREGLEPERLRAMLPLSLRWRPPFLGLVTIPSLASGFGDKPGGPSLAATAKTPGEARYLLRHIFARCARVLRRLPKPRATEAVDYVGRTGRYTTAETERKEAAVSAALRDIETPEILDIGCNTGRFSLLAARHGARVVAIDRDPAVIGRLWTSAGESRADVLPLVVDIGRPPGGCGWANREQAPFLERAEGRFDCVLMLALAHHLIVNERAPLDLIFDLLARLTRSRAVVEYVDPADPPFQRIARGRDALHRDLTPASFEAAARRRFAIVAATPVTPTRTVYTLDRRCA